ncbi:DUF2637 domain-containing protein [Streptomyces sp. NRRL F-5630]|uniref:DUF2637 domain-containing protein n=1 Tax=Streptomyces sp. NRRL F-5630 TaxID=1463864 RepID=UPI003D747935
MKNHSRWLAIGAAVVTISLTGAAFWLSFEHLHDIAARNGLTGKRAWMWPATVDLFIVAGELLILRASLRHRVDGWAIGLAASGSLGSIALNVAGVGADAELLEYVVAAVPPTAALVAFGALMRQVHEVLATGQTEPRPAVTMQPEPAREAPAETTTTEAPSRAPADAEESVVPVVTEPTTWDLSWLREPAAAVTGDMTTAVPAESDRRVVTEVVTLTPSELRKRARKLHREAVASTNRPVTIATLQDELGLSRREAAELRREIVDGSRS